MKWTLMALGAAVVLLLAADLLAFHDLFEPHTGTDWLMATATNSCRGLVHRVDRRPLARDRP